MNTNVLTNMACPKCGQSGQFKIQVKTMATVVDSGVLETEDNEWSNDSYATVRQRGRLRLDWHRRPTMGEPCRS